MTLRPLIPVLLALASLTAPAQPNPVIQTETRVVLVDAIVTGKNGAYVNDLTQSEFHVFQDNKEQGIKSFSLESATKAAEPRSLVLFFDESSMEARDQVLVRQDAARFIDAESGPGRRMAVVVYNGSLHVAQSFTDNAGRLKDALPATNANVTTEDKLSPGRMPASVSVASASGDLGARNMLRALRDLGRNLGVLPGRKIVVLFSGGIPSSSDQRIAVRDAIEDCNRSGVAVYPADVRSISVQTDQGNTPALPADRHPRPSRNGGLPGTPQGDTDTFGEVQNSGAGSQQIIFALANGTGGFVIRNSNDLLGGLQTIAAEQDEYYALTFTPPESLDGSCHTLRVKVERKGTTVRARSSYCTTKPLDLLAGSTAGKELESHASAPQPGNIMASIELPYFYLSPTVARVNLAMEIAPDGLKLENQKGKWHGEVNLLGIAATADGGTGARFSDTLKVDFDNKAQMEQWKTRPVHYEKEFRIAPGSYRFTMVFSSGGANFGRTEVPLVVEPQKPGGLSMSGLALSREIRAANDLGLGAGAGLMGEGTALIAEGMQIVPTGSSRFPRTGPAFYYFEVSGPDAAGAIVRVRAVDRKSGEAQWDTGPAKLSGLHQGAPIPVNTLPPGSYRLEVRLGDSPDKEVRRSVDFEVE